MVKKSKETIIVNSILYLLYFLMMKESEEMIIQMVMIHLNKNRKEAIEYYRIKLCDKDGDEVQIYSKINE